VRWMGDLAAVRRREPSAPPTYSRQRLSSMPVTRTPGEVPVCLQAGLRREVVLRAAYRSGARFASMTTVVASVRCADAGCAQCRRSPCGCSCRRRFRQALAGCVDAARCRDRLRPHPYVAVAACVDALKSQPFRPGESCEPGDDVPDGAVARVPGQGRHRGMVLGRRLGVATEEADTGHHYGSEDPPALAFPGAKHCSKRRRVLGLPADCP